MKRAPWQPWAICLLNLIDIAFSTYWFKHGYAIEANPLQALMIESWGMDLWIFWKAVWVTSLTLLLAAFWQTHRLTRVAGWIALIAYGAVAVWHLHFWLLEI